MTTVPPPTDVEIFNIDVTSATVTWTPPSLSDSSITSYQPSCTEIETGLRLPLENTKVCALKIEKLKPGTSYNFKISSIRGDYCSTSTELKKFTTLGGGPDFR